MKAAVELDAVKRAQAGVNSAASRLVGFKAAFVALENTTPDDAAVDAWVVRRAALEAQIVFAQRALDAAVASLATAEAAAAEKDAKARCAAVVRTAEAAYKLTLEVDVDVHALAKKIGDLDAMNDEIAAANADPDIRKFGLIVDGERQARERPGGEVPEILGEVEVWVDADGREPSQYRPRDGGAVGLDGSPLRRVKKSYVIRPAGFDPGHMPTRFADAIKLYNLAGKPLWIRD